MLPLLVLQGIGLGLAIRFVLGSVQTVVGELVSFGDLFLDEPMPVDGYVSLDATKPGFGVTLNPKVRSTFTRPHPHVSPSFVTIEAAKNDRTPAQDEWLQRAATRIPIGTDDA